MANRQPIVFAKSIRTWANTIVLLRLITSSTSLGLAANTANKALRVHPRRVLIVEQSKPGAVSGGKYARFHCLGMCLRYSESDELTNYRNQIEQAHRSIHTDISRNRHPCSEIWDSESRKNIAFENCSLNLVRWGIRKRTALEFPCLSPDRWTSC